MTTTNTTATTTTKTREQIGRDLLEAKLTAWLNNNPGGRIERNA
jgi:hypothetical protein